MFISDAPATTDSTKISAGAVPAKESPGNDPAGVDIESVLGHVEKLIAPVWPLADYVAVNPFLGLADRTFLDARRRLRAVSDAEMLMPLEYYRQQFATGQITRDDISEALQELNADTYAPRLSVDEVLKTLHGDDEPGEKSESTERLIQTVCETVDQMNRSSWSQHVQTEIGRYCGAHYDEGQAAWPNPWKHLSLYGAWKAAQRIDRRADSLGIPMFRKFVKSLPETPAEAIEHLLRRLGVPEDLWEDLLLCMAYTIPGWSAWTRYQGEMASRAENTNDDFVGLLAMRLAYDVAVRESSGLDIDWQAIAKTRSLVSRAGRPVATNDVDLRFVLLRASEIAWQRQALAEMNPDGTEARQLPYQEARPGGQLKWFSASTFDPNATVDTLRGHRLRSRRTDLRDSSVYRSRCRGSRRMSLRPMFPRCSRLHLSWRKGYETAASMRFLTRNNDDRSLAS